MEDSIQGENPWQVPSLDEFLYYCCPECDLKTKEHILFFEHAVKIHEQAKDVLCLQEEKHEQEDFVVPAGCGKSFESNDGYKKHLKEHNQEQDPLATKVIRPTVVIKRKAIGPSLDILDNDFSKKMCNKVQCLDCQNFFHPSLLEKHQKVCPNQKHQKETETMAYKEFLVEFGIDPGNNYKIGNQTYLWMGKQVPGKRCVYCNKNTHPSDKVHRKKCVKIKKQCQACFEVIKPTNLRSHPCYKTNKEVEFLDFIENESEPIEPQEDFISDGQIKIEINEELKESPDKFIHESIEVKESLESSTTSIDKGKTLAEFETYAYSCACKLKTNDQAKYEAHKIHCTIVQCYLCGLFEDVSRIVKHIEKKHKELTVDKSMYGPQKDKFPCKDCDFIAPTPWNLKLHQSEHHPSTALPVHFPCTDCDFVASTPRKLNRHWSDNHLPKNLSCNTCKREFSTKTSFFEHQKKVHSKRRCEVCNFEDEIPKLKIHMREEHPEYKPYQCKPCGLSYAFKIQLHQHRNSPDALCKKMGVNDNTEQNQEETSSNPFVCETCGKIFNKLQPLIAHTKKMHGIDPTKDMSSNFICEKCGMGFGSNYNLQQHMKKHTQKFHICVLCDKITTSKKLLQDHLSSIHNNSFSSRFAKDIYPCSECGEKYDSSSSLNIHLTVQHSFSADHQCPDCEKILVSNTLLTAHKMEVHLFKPGYKAKKSETDVQCKICGKYLKNEKTLATHTLQEHEKEKHKYRCEQCDYSTYEPSRLKIHFNDVHRVAQDFKCIKCDYLTNTKKKLHQHEVTCHNINRFNLKVYMCEYCDSKQMFPKKGVFGLHLLKVHNIVTDSIHLKPGK